MESGWATTRRPEGLWEEGVSPRLLCRFGCNCRAKLNCLWVHKPKVQQWFVDEQALLQRRMMMECLFCARGECKYGERCMRSQRAREMRTSRLDSDYESGSEENSGGGTVAASRVREGRCAELEARDQQGTLVMVRPGSRSEVVRWHCSGIPLLLGSCRGLSSRIKRCSVMAGTRC